MKRINGIAGAENASGGAVSGRREAENPVSFGKWGGRPNVKRFYDLLAAGAMFITLLFITAALLPTACMLAGGGGASERADSDGIFRLHIIANSDSDRDVRIKLAVRDAVLAYEREKTGAAEAADAAEAERILADNGAGLLAAARSVLAEYGADYDAQLMIGEFDFPDRQYGETLYPAGRYRALRILLGDAAGQNWWCVMFPPLCILTTGTEKIEPETPVRFDSLIVRLWRAVFGG